MNFHKSYNENSNYYFVEVSHSEIVNNIDQKSISILIVLYNVLRTIKVSWSVREAFSINEI